MAESEELEEPAVAGNVTEQPGGIDGVQGTAVAGPGQPTTGGSARSAGVAELPGADLADLEQADLRGVDQEDAAGEDPPAEQPSAQQRSDGDPDAEDVDPDGDAEDEDAEGDAEDEDAGEDEDTDPFPGITGLAPDNAGPGAAAFFDVDNTVMRGSSFAALAKGMADRDYFTASEIVGITWKQLKFVVSGRENLEDIAAATENGLQFVQGREVAEIVTLSDEVYDEKMVKRLWSGTLELAEAHLRMGHEVWLVSATPIEIAQVIATRLGLTGGLGTVAEVVDGRYTGKLQGTPLHGQAKADTILSLAQEAGIDLARSSAYSDSANDVPMLSLVGHPVAVNPDGKLRAYAKEHGWPIRDYRIRGKESVRKGVPAAAAAGLIAGAAVGVAKGIAVLRGRAPLV